MSEMKSKYMMMCFISSWVVVMMSTAQSAITLPRNETIPAIIGFGDSIIDAGNNNALTTLVKANFLPYGRDFDGAKPTGRFSNGKIPTDLLAHELGIKDTIPAYLDPNLRPEDMITGVTFASGGCGYDSLTSKLVSVLSLSDQLAYFREYMDKLKANVGEDKTSSIIAKSLYLLVAGSDDIANTYFLSRVRKFNYDVPSYTTLMVNSTSTFLKELYELGARRIAVFSAPPIGCVPSQRTLFGGVVRGCAEDVNQAAQKFNTKLLSTIDTLNSQFRDSKIVYIDIYNPLLDLIQNPQKYGLVYAEKGCCSTGTIEVAVLCNKYSATCRDESDYVFWDSYHPTENAYKALILPLINKYLTTFF